VELNIMTDETTIVTATPTELTPSAPEPPSLAADPASLAREMGQAYQQMVAYYSKEMSASEADARARAPVGTDLERLLETPPDQVSWWALGRVAGHDPEQARAIWERTLTDAQNEFASGNRGAKSVEARGTPWERAQYLAVLDTFIAELQPRGGVECALIDTLAQAYTTQLRWLARLTLLSNAEAQRQDLEMKQNDGWRPPTIEASAAIDQAAAMVDRFNRLFARTLRALRDLRRYTPQVVVQNVGQLNLAQSQVNVARAELPTDQVRIDDSQPPSFLDDT
jgi:hypothetical protein